MRDHRQPPRIVKDPWKPTFVLWFWKPSASHKANHCYTPKHVNAMVEMITRNCWGPHNIICITDDPTGIDCACVPLLDVWRKTAVPGGMPPQSWTRLQCFAPDYQDYVESFTGFEVSRTVHLDLDCCITGDITGLLKRSDVRTGGVEPFVGWLARGFRAKPCVYNASMWQLVLGSHPEVFHRFNPEVSPAAIKARGYIGTEQAWVSAILGDAMPAWSHHHGVCSYRFQVADKKHNTKIRSPLFTGTGKLPDNARIVFFHGSIKPWNCRDAWVKEHYPQ